MNSNLPDWYFVIKTLEDAGCTILGAEISAFVNAPFTLIKLLSDEQRKIATQEVLKRWPWILAGWEDAGIHLFLMPTIYLYDPLKDPDDPDRPIIRCTIVDATLGNGLKVPMFSRVHFGDPSPDEEFYNQNSLIPIGPYQMSDQNDNDIPESHLYYASLEDAIVDAGAFVHDGKAEIIYIQNAFGNTIESMSEEDIE